MGHFAWLERKIAPRRQYVKDWPLGRNQGQTVQVSRVVESRGSSGGDGKSELFYQSLPAEDWPVSPWPIDLASREYIDSNNKANTSTLSWSYNILLFLCPPRQLLMIANHWTMGFSLSGILTLKTAQSPCPLSRGLHSGTIYACRQEVSRKFRGRHCMVSLELRFLIGRPAR